MILSKNAVNMSAVVVQMVYDFLIFLMDRSVGGGKDRWKKTGGRGRGKGGAWRGSGVRTARRTYKWTDWTDWTDCTDDTDGTGQEDGARPKQDAPG